MGQTQCCQDHFLHSKEQLQPKVQTGPPPSKTSRKIVMNLLSSTVRNMIQKMPPYVPLKLEIIPQGFRSESYIETKKPSGYYCGQWIERKCHGKGQFFYKDGSYYQGTFMNGVAEGEGRFIDKNGCIYEGQIKQNQANGTGIFRDVLNRYEYKGQWANNKPHGCGNQNFSKGQSYEGGFVQGFKQGYGKYSSKQAVYQGYFAHNVFEGQGTMDYADHRRYQGMWKNGYMSGQGIFYWPDGSRHEGTYKQGLKDGRGTFYFANGNIFRGTWLNGLKHGKGQLFVKDKIISSIWKMNELQSII